MIVDSDRKYINLPGIQRKFNRFNRNPYPASFIVENRKILIAHCHLIYGPSRTEGERKASMEKRQLKACAVSRWCDLRRDDKHFWTSNIFAVGDFQLPDAVKSDPVFDALTKRGRKVMSYGTHIPTNVSGTAYYDQIAVTPGLKTRIKETGIFDFDDTIFSSIYSQSKPGYWRSCAKYYISDHRSL